MYTFPVFLLHLLQEVAYYSLKTATNLLILLELTFKAGVNGVKVCVKTEQPPFAPLAAQRYGFEEPF